MVGSIKVLATKKLGRKHALFKRKALLQLAFKVILESSCLLCPVIHLSIRSKNNHLSASGPEIK